MQSGFDHFQAESAIFRTNRQDRAPSAAEIRVAVVRVTRRRSMRAVRTLMWVHGKREQLQPFVDRLMGMRLMRMLMHIHFQDGNLATWRIDSLQLVEIFDHQQPASIHRIQQCARQSRVRARSLESLDYGFLPVNQISRTRNVVARLLDQVSRQAGHAVRAAVAD